ncbi:glycosyltransferase [Echinicola sp. CAU 1574]|uniref:Glycosyltransferase n=1 Tax=Echinicola arenosa TaxID=2774144 RepID=A0ABR9AQA1_9BACT|nr:glycosyltransferase [Echinicola arenosa]MBD8490038.1 glycosyltransferase [Echinicola arenosa]
MPKNNSVKYSICIPAYKSKFLKECIESILDQTVKDFELIILNDCSPQPIEEVVTHFDDPRIQYHKNQSNVGALNLVDNWNKCLSLAKGEYIVIMGDDDLLEPDYLEEFSRMISQYPDLNVYHCRSQIIDDNGDTRLLTPALPPFENVYDSIWHRLEQLRSNYISDYLYKTESLKKQGGFFHLPLAWGSDDITAFIASAENGIAHSNKPVFKYRSHGLSISSTSSNGLMKLEADLGYAAWLKAFLLENPQEKKVQVVYRHLVENQDHYMTERKIFTMTKIMAGSKVPNVWIWLRHRKQYGLAAKDILLAAAKSRNMRNKA